MMFLAKMLAIYQLYWQMMLVVVRLKLPKLYRGNVVR